MESLVGVKVQSWLTWFLRGILILGLLLLLGRLIELQIIRGHHFKLLAEGNRIRRVTIAAPRGGILARGGEVLIGNSPVSYGIAFNPQSGYQKKEATMETPQDEIITETKREYRLGSIFAHLSGYLGQVNQDEVNKIKGQCPQKGPKILGSLIGRSGLEQEYECLLSGIDGEELVEVDTRGEKVRVLGKRNPLPGEDLKTTIDYGLQQKVAKVMEGKKGVAIVSDKEGQILAFYSSPSFDPNRVADYLDDPDLPLFNRGIGGSYHPGSVFKIVTAIAGLEEDKIDRDYRYEDTGKVIIYPDEKAEIKQTYEFTNWYFSQYGGVEGEIDLTRAITRSTDTFFYKLGEFLGVEKLAEWAERFGLGKKTGIDLPGEISGLVPTPQWKEQFKGEHWFLGNTYHMAIGQGDIALTPIAVNQMVTVIANNGRLCQPRIALDQRTDCQDLKIDRENLELVKQGMVGACSEGGTAFPFFGFDPQVACKTGTAETDEEDKTHAWFVAFAPADFPELVATVLVEKGGEGSDVAAPLVREIFDYYFHP